MLLFDGPDDSLHTLVLAHGAGGGMRSSFMTAIARQLAANKIRVVRFEFPYMKAGRKRPDPTNTLLDAWREVVSDLGGGPSLFIGGKSLGGRMASMVADELSVRGLVCLGYPFHPPGQPQKLRTAHLEGLRTRSLIIQGTRDPFGTRSEVTKYTLSTAIDILWIDGADHSLRSADHISQAVEAVVTFITTN